MPYIQEISFFHKCGHSEKTIWSSDGDIPKESIRLDLPEIDFGRVIFDSEEEGIDNREELYYHKGLCSACTKSGQIPIHLILSSREVLAKRRVKWEELVDLYQLKLKGLPTPGEERKQLELQAEIDILNIRLQLEKSKEALKPRRWTEIEAARPWCAHEHEQNCWCHPNEIERERSQEIIRELEIQISRSWFDLARRKLLNNKGEFFRTFNAKDREQEAQANLDPKKRVYLLAQGLDTKLLAFPNMAKCKKEENCSICKEDVFIGRARTLPCDHLFHYGCISSWLRTENTCPMCRREYEIMRPAEQERNHGTWQPPAWV